MIKLIATFFYAGLMRPAPCTWGSAAAVPAAWLIHWAFSFPGLLVATVVVFVLGWWATAEYQSLTGTEDPKEVVIDEVAGMFIALMPLSLGLWLMSAPAYLFPYPGWIAGFLLFRLFDIWKPGPVGWADRRGDALGVMLDDIIAGAFAAAITAGLAAISHLVIMG
jgi:phosphatidylglycerophosphatase A